MKKILLIGERYSPNLGDGVIYDVVFGLLKKNYIITCLDFAGKSSYSLNTTCNEFSPIRENCIYLKNKIYTILNIFNFNKILKQNDPLTKDYKSRLSELLIENKYDVIIFAGGQLFMDCFLYKILYTLDCANNYNIPVVFNACGKGQISNYNNIKNIINSNCVKYISVRDNFHFFKKYDDYNKVFETYDTAILCNNIYIESKKQKNIGIGIMISHKISFKKQLHFWQNIIKYCIDNKLEWEIFCNGNIDDYNFGKYILKSMELDYDHICQRPIFPNELVSTVTKYNKIISMRLHSLVIAYSYKIPAIAISWDKKVDEFYKKINRESFCFNFNSNLEDIKKSIITINNDFDQKQILSIEQDISNNIKQINRIINKFGK